MHSTQKLYMFIKCCDIVETFINSTSTERLKNAGILVLFPAFQLRVAGVQSVAVSLTLSMSEAEIRSDLESGAKLSLSCTHITAVTAPFGRV